MKLTPSALTLGGSAGSMPQPVTGVFLWQNYGIRSEEVWNDECRSLNSGVESSENQIRK